MSPPPPLPPPSRPPSLPPAPLPCLTRFALSLLSGVPSAFIPASLPPTLLLTPPAPPRPRGSA